MILLHILCNNRVSHSYLFYSKFWNFWGAQKGSKIRIGCPKDKWMGLWLKPWTRLRYKGIVLMTIWLNPSKPFKTEIQTSLCCNLLWFFIAKYSALSFHYDHVLKQCTFLFWYHDGNQMKLIYAFPGVGTPILGHGRDVPWSWPLFF